MDENQWGWAESILRICTQIASREPLVTQYEGMLSGLLTDQACALGLTVHREIHQSHYDPHRRENYLIRHETGGIAMRRLIGNEWAWWAQNYTQHVDFQVGRHNVDGHPDVFLKIELKTGSIFPYTHLANLVREYGPSGWWNDLVHLAEPEENPRADAFLFVVDEAVYRAMTGYQVKRSPPRGGGRPPGVSEFGPFCPTLEAVKNAAGGQVEGGGIHLRTNVELRSICRMVRCRATYPPYWCKLPEDADWIGGENGVHNDTMVVGIVGVPSE